VAAKSPRTELPLWNVVAFATATVRLRMAKAVRITVFIGKLHLRSGGMPG
jgi:hypothetical protein